MPIYRGKGVPGQPGFEMEEFEGMYVSPNGKYWGNEPIDEEQERLMDEQFNRKPETRRERRARERYEKYHR
jgi:hypothetical protein